MGLESHFARLRLLDAERYHDIERFKEEEQHYVAVASAIDALDELPQTASARERVATVADDRDSQALLATLCHPEASPEQQDTARAQLRDALLDRHGTGRVMFRNSRRHVGGFPSDACIPLRSNCRRPTAACCAAWSATTTIWTSC